MKNRINKLRDMDSKPIVKTYTRQTRMLPYKLLARTYLSGLNAGRILEVGCGPGMLLSSMAKSAPNAAVLGLDIAKEMLARATIVCDKDDINLCQGSVYAIPFADSSFDLIIGSSLLHTLDDLSTLFQETARVLKKDGRAWFPAFRRDALLPFRLMGDIHTKWCSLTKVPLDGMGKVFEASYTKNEIVEILKDIEGITWDVEASSFRLDVKMRKTLDANS